MNADQRRKIIPLAPLVTLLLTPAGRCGCSCLQGHTLGLLFTSPPGALPAKLCLAATLWPLMRLFVVQSSRPMPSLSAWQPCPPAPCLCLTLVGAPQSVSLSYRKNLGEMSRRALINVISFSVWQQRVQLQLCHFKRLCFSWWGVPVFFVILNFSVTQISCFLIHSLFQSSSIFFHGCFVI